MVNSREENSDSIPIDLISEIFSRLPAKSVARFRSLSKLWRYMFLRPYFTDLFLTRSSARPPSSRKPQPHNPYGKSSLVVTAGFPVKIPEVYLWMEFCGYASGLICFCYIQFSYKVHVICNPSTGQCASLPKLRTHGGSYSFFGFDPIDKKVKVLFKAYDDHRILTLGTGEMSWRNIQCPIPINPSPYSKGMCINGVLYYIAEHNTFEFIVCFDVRSEKFKFIEKGKLGGIFMKYGTPELHLWVLEDVEKQKWSEYVYTLPDYKFVDLRYVTVAGVTATGEIVLSMRYASKPFYVLYLNPERSTHQSVEIQGFGDYDDENFSVKVFVDHVEDLNFYR
ncbi:hypothetical protein EUTSA_v10009523mg [Eutrema salsugineum]|uniref:F-box domain-containing protein n=1 Tax=Eutrema salsugineum TaxID=72664 RepID=V4L1V4_EUTSA|nr:hypothetical protein EUTSA_v10009523mg [Eutrema salsugineum]